jgi:hypothetical protein
MRNQAGDLVMNIDATLSDNSTLSARLWHSSWLAARSPTYSDAASRPLSAKGLGVKSLHPGSGSRRDRPMMDRRAFITMVTGSILAAPLAAEAQQTGKVYHIGHVSLTSPEEMAPYLQAFEEGFRELDTSKGETSSSRADQRTAILNS